MYYDRFFPFYVAYANPALYDGERIQEQEFALMKSYYPEAAGRIQEKVEEECQLLDYEGSRLYDEYPEGETAAQGVPDSLMDDLIQVLLCQEISRRRCRRRRNYGLYR